MFLRCILVLCLLVGPVWADTVRKISMQDLQRRGVYPRNFSIFRVAGDGRTLLAADEPPFTVKAKGVLHRLWVIRLTPELRIDKAQAYNLPVPQIEQANFTPDLRSVLISSKRGADIHKLDLESGELSVVQTHEAGKAGFRIHSDVFSLYNGKLYTVGYFYDEQDYAGPDQMVEIDPARTGPEAFKVVLDLAPIGKNLKNLRIASMLAPEGLLFYTEDEPARRWSVYRWSQPSGLVKIDEGQTIEGSWGEGPVGVYSIRRPGDTFELVMVNAQTGEKTVLGTNSARFVNPCMAHDANTVVCALDTKAATYNFLVAQDTRQFALRPFLENYPVGTLRVSSDGRVICHFNGGTGITLVRLEDAATP